MRKNTPHKYLRGVDFIRTLKNHFFKYVPVPENDNDCMEWLGYVNPSGYGKLMHNLKSLRAHRISYKIFIGEIPSDKEVCHSCDNTKCINPNHLFLGTHQDNMKDMIKKQRWEPLRGNQRNDRKLCENDIIVIRDYLSSEKTYSEIAKFYQVDKSTIRRIVLKKSWRHVA